MTCPHCATPLSGLGRFCHACGQYTADHVAAGAPQEASAAREALPDTRSEAEIRLAIRRALEALGFDVYDLEQNRPTRQTPGLGDLYVLGHGRCAWGEVKRAQGRQSEAQQGFEARVLTNGGEYHVWRHESEAIAWAQEVRSSSARRVS